MKLKNRTALITGANRGFGLAVARIFLREGASLVICARDRAKLQEAEQSLAADKGPGQEIWATPCDVSDEKDVQALVKFALVRARSVEILVNNAGVYGPKGDITKVNSREWRQAVAVNLFGTFSTCQQLVPHFREKHYGKIINLSGGGATAPLPYLSAYAASKTAVVRFTETLAHEVKDWGIDCNAIAPGALNTRLLDEILEAGPQAVGEEFYRKAIQQKQDGGVPLETGAELCVFLASAASDGITGRILSAVWDPWEDLPRRAADLASSDIYTLRRIVPKDRNRDWGERK